RLGAIPGVAGAVFRVAGEMQPWAVARAALAQCRASGLRVSLHVRLSRGNPGSSQADEHWVTSRAAQALFAAAAHDDLHAYLDTFADVDRGYFMRQGVVDRLYNPRPASHALRNLGGALVRGLDSDAPARYAAAGDESAMALVDSRGRRYDLMLDPHAQPAGEGAGCVIDLRSGERVRGERTSGGGFNPPLPHGPCLWIANA
ncbi:MAG: hypothetical protein ACR2RL_09935, partial [Gammaproteobacteria bacterium]